jgi:cell division inhibitor SepF
MTLGSSLRRAVGYFDSSAKDSYDDETITVPQEFRPYREEPPDVRRLRHEEAADYDEIYADAPRAYPRRGQERAANPLTLVRPPSAEFCLLAPAEFNDAQQIADRFRADAAVICNMQGCETALARRLTDFCSGLVYALDGSLQRLDDKVLLLAPRDLELSSEAAAGFLEKGFFNQI